MVLDDEEARTVGKSLEEPGNAKPAPISN